SGPWFKPPSLAGVTPPKAPSAVQQPLPPAPDQPQATGSVTQGGAVNLPASAVMPRWLVWDPLWHGGAAAKCIDRHYAPWADGVPTLQAPTVTHKHMPKSSEAMARSFHNVCVQAMTADYAGDGQSYTIPGTVVAILDLTDLPVQKDLDVQSLKLGAAA